ncbi:MAG: family 20 glycosylhydrolase [Armatimonadota bacterium]
MSTFNINLSSCPEALRAGLAEIIAHRADRFGEQGMPLAFTQGGVGLSIQPAGAGLQIRFGTKNDAFRALGRVLGGATSGEEASTFDMLGAMVDVSRNGVLTVPAAKDYLRCCALMGLNMVMLYSEDTYEVPGEPFFGYLRGRYSQVELKELDDYAFALGIEMIPCIQTLAHLEQILQWPVYQELRDIGGVLIAEEDRTYVLVEKLITAASAPFRTRRIHLGMDEAWGLGSGRFKERHGEKSGFEILNTHLARVRSICDKLGVKPMIWGDMYVHLASTSGNIYDYGSKIPQEVIDKIPQGVDLVYWDYYHTDTKDYEQGIDLYRQLGAPLLTAGGGWTWNRLVAHLPYAFAATNACMTACKAKGMKDYFMTLWGDDGMECDVFTALPALQLAAEHAYAGTVTDDALKANFRGSCDADLDDYFTASKIDYLAFQHDGTKGPDNMSKWLLWQDPLFALTEPNLEGVDLQGYYAGLADTLEPAAQQGGSAWHLSLPAHIARTLSLKVDLRPKLASAYKAGDKAALREILNGQLTKLQSAMDALWRCHRDTWLAVYKPFGLEVIELRYGGQRTRLQSLAERLAAYLDGKVADIPELEIELLKVWDDEPRNLSPDRRRMQTPSNIK